MAELDAQAIINYIGNAPKKTPVKVYLKGNLNEINFPEEVQSFIDDHTGVIFGDWSVVEPLLKENADLIADYHIENDCRNSAVPLLDLKGLNARIEPGATIRDKVLIGNNAVVMMGATINIGAGTVLAGVVEPASAQPVRIDDNVLIGANAVVIEGVHVGEGAVVAAGAIVTHDVEPHTMVAGVPAKFVKKVDAKTESKTGLEDDLRKL